VKLELEFGIILNIGKSPHANADVGFGEVLV
jgi:hypothetical protein